MSQPIPKPTPHRLVKARRKRAQRKADRLVYEAAVLRDGGHCTRCGVFGVQMHHKRFRSLGGKTELANLESLCVSCHQKAHRL